MSQSQQGGVSSTSFGATTATSGGGGGDDRTSYYDDDLGNDEYGGDDDDDGFVTSGGETTTIITATTNVTKSTTDRYDNKLLHFWNRFMESGLHSKISKYTNAINGTSTTTGSIPLPMICVMGDTSSGKSSVLSNLSGIDFPASSTITTRCPVHLYMKKLRIESYNNNKNHRLLPNPSSLLTHDDDLTTSNEEKKMDSFVSASSYDTKDAYSKNQLTNTEATITNPTKVYRRARISIQWKTTKDGRLNNKRHNPNSKYYFPERIISMVDWDTIPAIIMQAQECIVAATQNYISNDCIVIVVESTEYQYDLTLIDLPGFIRGRSSTEDTVVATTSSKSNDKTSTSSISTKQIQTELQAVIEEYITNPACIIMAVHPANVDLHNAQIIADAYQVDPQTIRTIPVLTKPDLIDPGAERDIVTLLNGQTNFHYAMGFHLIKGRGQAALDTKESIEQCLQNEEEYFTTVEPWKSQIMNRDVLGTTNLWKKLNTIQYSMIQRYVPSIIETIVNRRNIVLQTLDEMGDVVLSTIDQRRYYQDLCNGLVAIIQTSLSGKKSTSTTSPRNASHNNNNHQFFGKSSSRSGGRRSITNTSNVTASPRENTNNVDTDILQTSSSTSPTATKGKSAASQLHEACSTFMSRLKECSLANIRSIEEDCHVLVLSPHGGQWIRGHIVHLNESYACVDYIDESDRESDVLFHSVGYQSAIDIEENDVWIDSENKIYIARSNNMYDQLKKIPLLNIRTDPFWIKTRIEQNRTDDLPCFLNGDIFKSIIQEFIEEDWKPHCTALLETTKAIVTTTVHDSIQNSITDTIQERYPKLHTWIQQQCNRAIDDVMKQATNEMESYLEIEKHPYTQDSILFENLSKVRYTTIQRELEVALRIKDTTGSTTGTNTGVVYDTQAIQEIMEQVFSRNQKRSADDIMAEEMESILESYGTIATRRVIDRIPMIVWNTIFRVIPLKIRDVLLWDVDDQLSILQQSSTFRTTFQSFQHELKELNYAMEIIESIFG